MLFSNSTNSLMLDMHHDTVWPSPMEQPKTVQWLTNIHHHQHCQQHHHRHHHHKVSHMLQIKLDFPDSPLGSP